MDGVVGAEPNGRQARRSLSLAVKLTVLIILLAMSGAAAIGVVSYFSARDSQRAGIDQSLSIVVDARRDALQAYLGTIDGDLRVLAQSPLARQAVLDFMGAWGRIDGDRTETLQTLYITDNPHPLGQKDALDAAKDGSSYSAVHARLHPWFRTFLKERGFYDIFLFDLDGNLIYTVFKELDFATNLVSGPWAETDLGNAFRAARDGAANSEVAFFDFRPYAPSNDAPASFIATAINDADGAPLGVLVFQMPIDGINATMQAAHMGETGEAMIIGTDRLMRNDSRFSEESTILTRVVDMEAVSRALAGETGVMDDRDFEGNAVAAAFTPLDFHGTRWAIVTRQSLDEVLAPVRALRDQLLLFGVAGILVIAVLGGLLGRGIARPIAAMTAAMRRLAGGDKEIDVPGRTRGDEIGAMAEAVETFRRNALEMDRMALEQAEFKQRSEAENKRATAALADEFEASVSGVVDRVFSGSESVRASAQTMSSMADRTSRQSAEVSAAADEATGNVQTVAAATEELTGSIAEIGRRVGESTTIAREAVKEAEGADTTVKGLTDAAQKIGEVVSLISDIASQTNLLALNATIEAARAGEAGKGFAVVASEVKSLANQTAKATDDISSQIAAMQTATSGAVGAIQGIGATIGRIEETVAAIAAAIEQQQSATQEIARNVHQAATGTQTVSGTISGVSDAAANTGQTATELLEAAGDLSDQAGTLRQEVEAFLARIRAA
ncbi:MAG: methyl-accepting chemotaxis protein [Inquilinaceae bacterium]